MTKFLQDLLFKGALSVDGAVTLSTAAGTGTRMVVANAAGLLSTQTITGGVSGTGTTNYLARWTGSTALGTSVIYDNGSIVAIGTSSPNTQSMLTLMGTSTYSKSIVLDSTWNYQTSFAMKNGIYSTEFNLGGSTKSAGEGGPGSLQISTYNATTFTYRYPMTFFANANVSFGGTSGSVPADNGSTLQVNGTVYASSLTGSGTRMVVADASGVLSTQAVPSFTESDTLASVTTRGATTTNSISVGGLTVATPSGGAGILFDSTAGGGSQWSIQSFSSVNDIPNAIGFYNPVSATTPLVITPTKLQVKNSYQLIWGFDDAEYADSGIPNVGIAWEAANTLKLTNGSTGYGSLKALNLTTTGDATISGVLSVNSRLTAATYDTGSGGSNVNTYLELKNNNNDGYGEGLSLAYGRGTLAVPQNVQTGDVLGGVYFKAYSASAVRNLAYIESIVTGVGTYAKTKLVFATGADDTYAYVGMILNEDAKLFLGYNLVDQGAYRLQVGGAIYASGALFTSLAGTGTRMVVTDANGTLGSQAMPAGSLQGSVDADKSTSGSLSIGTTIVKAVSATTYSGVFFDYVVKNGTNVRVGSVVAISNGTNVEFYETLSNDIGTTTDVTFTVTLGSGNINLNAVAAATGWTVIISTRAI